MKYILCTPNDLHKRLQSSAAELQSDLMHLCDEFHSRFICIYRLIRKCIQKRHDSVHLITR